MTATTTSTSETPASACGELDGWSSLHERAWLGMLQTHRQLTRQLDATLEARHGLTLSGLELLSRLATHEERRAHLSTLAEQIGLSISGISRLVDTLEHAGLVERQTCPNDGRATNAWLTESGLRLVREAQSTHYARVRERFFDHVDDGELRMLVDIFERFAPEGHSACEA